MVKKMKKYNQYILDWCAGVPVPELSYKSKKIKFINHCAQGLLNLFCHKIIKF